MTKHDLFAQGRQLAGVFLKVNRFPLPTFYIDPEAAARDGHHAVNRWQDTGNYFASGKIWVNLERCALPGTGAFRRWSFPGYKVDRTPVGVVCHEVGHYVDELTRWSSRLADWRAIWKHSPRVSGYEPVAAEAFAESVRLYITNPDLLRQGSPPRFDFLLNVVGLKPSVLSPFDRVLKSCGAHPRLLTAAHRWVADAKKREER